MTWQASFQSLGPRDRRALRIGAWTVVPLLAITMVIRPWTASFIARREALDRARGVLMREQRALDGASRDRQRLAALHIALDESFNQLFAATDAATASAELARYVGSRAIATGVTLERTETETALDDSLSTGRAEHGARTAVADSTQPVLRVAIRGRGDTRAIIALLRAVETGPRLIRVERIGITRESVDGESVNGRLSFTATFVGLARNETPADSRARSITAVSAPPVRADPLTFASTVAPVLLARDPFRSRHSEWSDGAVSTGTTPAPTIAAIRLLGTVIRGGGGFAVCQLSAESPRIVHIGERLGELTLESLEQGRAVFRSANGARLTLSLATPGT